MTTHILCCIYSATGQYTCGAHVATNGGQHRDNCRLVCGVPIGHCSCAPSQSFANGICGDHYEREREAHRYSGVHAFQPLKSAAINLLVQSIANFVRGSNMQIAPRGARWSQAKIRLW